MADKTFAFGVWQGGIMVANVEAPTLHDALREISRYGVQYQQDGPIEILQIDPDTLEPLLP